jgi:hypothetical protein
MATACLDEAQTTGYMIRMQSEDLFIGPSATDAGPQTAANPSSPPSDSLRGLLAVGAGVDLTRSALDNYAHAIQEARGRGYSFRVIAALLNRAFELHGYRRDDGEPLTITRQGVHAYMRRRQLKPGAPSSNPSCAVSPKTCDSNPTSVRTASPTVASNRLPSPWFKEHAPRFEFAIDMSADSFADFGLNPFTPTKRG